MGRSYPGNYASAATCCRRCAAKKRHSCATAWRSVECEAPNNSDTDKQCQVSASGDGTAYSSASRVVCLTRYITRRLPSSGTPRKHSPSCRCGYRCCTRTRSSLHALIVCCRASMGSRPQLRAAVAARLKTFNADGDNSHYSSIGSLSSLPRRFSGPVIGLTRAGAWSAKPNARSASISPLG